MRRFGDVEAVAGVDLSVDPGEILAVLGPSGCGKSTLLRIIAGLEPADAGSVRWGGRSIDGMPPHRRGIGLMFQDHALFPHKDVFANVAFGLRMQGVGGRRRDARVHEVLELVGLSGHARRDVDTLSGGEAQRVALARTLAPAPGLVLLDEPLGSLDRDLRERLSVELRSLLRTAGTTAVHVTHDHDEAFTVSDRIALMRAGRLVQVGEPEHVRRHPADDDVARFLGVDALIDVAGGTDGVHTPWGRLAVGEWPPGVTRAVVLPEGLRLHLPGAHLIADPATLVVDATTIRSTYRGDRYLSVVRTDGPEVELHLSAPGRLDPGQAVLVEVRPEAIAPVGPPPDRAVRPSE